MARTREFDPQEALVRAMNVFWIKGYRHTSLMNLVQDTGVGKKGLYTVFGNKHDLYIKAMEYYKCMQAEELLPDIEKRDAGVAEILDLFNRALNFTRSDLGTRGCMVCNAMAEFGDRVPEISHATSSHIERFRQALRNALLNSVNRNELDHSVNVNVYANFLSSVLQSLMLMSRAGTDFNFMKDTVDVTLHLLRH